MNSRHSFQATLRASFATMALLCCVVRGDAPLLPTTVPADASEFATYMETGPWMQSYYRNPEPERIEAALRAIVKADKLVDPNQRESIAAFCARVFAAHPERVPKWAAYIDTLDSGSQSTLWIAMWWADTPMCRDAVRARAVGNNEINVFCREEIVGRNPSRDYKALRSPNPATLDGCWSSFFATGDEAYVQALIRVAAAPATADDTREVTRQAARWSLQSLSQKDDRIRDILSDFIREKASDAERASLADIVQSTQPATTPVLP